MTSKGKILITGATGVHGIKGAFIVDELVRLGYPVRAMARVEDDRCKALRDLGAEVVVADFRSHTELCDAMQGIRRAYFCYPMKAGIVEATVNVASAAIKCGVEAIVNLSLMVAKENAPSPVARGHWMSERIFDWAGTDVVHLRGGFFYENVFELAGVQTADTGELAIPFGTGKARLAWISATDIARFAAALLQSPEAHRGKTYFVTGHVYSFLEIAGMLTDHLGRRVTFTEIAFDRWKNGAHVQALFGDNPELEAHVGMLSSLFSRERTFGRPTPTFKQVTGRAPETFKEYLAHEGPFSVGPTPVSPDALAHGFNRADL